MESNSARYESLSRNRNDVRIQSELNTHFYLSVYLETRHRALPHERIIMLKI